MSIIWFEDQTKNGVITLYPSNITLNKSACDNFENAYCVMLGINPEDKMVFIKPLSKDQAIRGDIPEKQMYKITIRSSYGRITNKLFMDQIQKCGNFTIKNPMKFVSIWDYDEKVLKFSLKEEISC